MTTNGRSLGGGGAGGSMMLAGFQRLLVLIGGVVLTGCSSLGTGSDRGVVPSLGELNKLPPEELPSWNDPLNLSGIFKQTWTRGVNPKR